MAEQNAVATQQGTQLSVAAQVKSMISQDAVKKKFTEVLGQKAPQFLASITNVVAGSAQLKKCPATTIMSAAFVAATYDLPIDSNLGFAAIVPYNNNKYNQQTRQWEKHPEAQFQMMYKGFIQLAIRSGYYEKMNCSVVYKDELVSYNPITGEVEFVTDLGQNADMGYIGDPNSFLLAYATDTPSVEEPSAGYIFTWDMLENGILFPILNYPGAPGTHSELVEGLMAYDMKKTADDLAFFGCDAV